MKKKGQSAQGFTLVESLVVIALVGILALAMIPVFSSQHPARLGAAAFGQVDMAPRFFKGGTPYTQLLIGPGPQLQAFEGGINRGALEAGSGVVLTLGLQTTTVSLNEATGKVTIP